MKKPKRIEVWAFHDSEEFAGWSFSFDPPTKRGLEHFARKGRRAVRCVELPPGSVVVSREGANASAALRRLLRRARAALVDWSEEPCEEFNPNCRDCVGRRVVADIDTELRKSRGRK